MRSQITASRSELLLLADRINRSGFACPPNERERALILAALIKWAAQEMRHKKGTTDGDDDEG